MNPPQPPLVNLLCAGAAKGLVQALQPNWLADSGASVQGRFGAVGAMQEALLAGEPCDVFVATQAMVSALVQRGLLVGTSVQALGRVRTGVAVRGGEARPDIGSAEGLKAALLAAPAIYFPDPERATAGIHFARVMQQLGVHDTLAPRFRTHPNGATAMRALADEGLAGAIGCTQVTEIHYTAGIDLVAALPPAFELVTVYSAAISAAAAADGARAGLASGFLALLAGPASQALRAAGGFEG